VFDTIPLNRFVVCSQGTPVRNSDDGALPDYPTCLKRNWNKAASEKVLLQQSTMYASEYVSIVLQEFLV
jgi:hypothetical protein